MIRLGVNIDHVATLRQVRGTSYPSPVQAAMMAESAGADFITLHLREDRRHIQDRDVAILREALTTAMNLEIALTDEMVAIACEIRPQEVCFVPERRQELTTEGGLDVPACADRLRAACATLAEAGIRVSLFIDPHPHQLDAARAIGAPVVELHTGTYATACNEAEQAAELARLAAAVEHGVALGLRVNAGHGLNYHNVQPIARLPAIRDLNIGHAIVAQALFVGWEQAVREMKLLLQTAAAKR